MGTQGDIVLRSRVLIDGGTGDYRVSTEIYHPDTGDFSASGSIGNAYLIPETAILLIDGKILLTLRTCCDPSDLAEIYTRLPEYSALQGK
jgi:hypothetical protein